jgi:hypothetical protein
MSRAARPLRAPSGHPPPRRAALPDGGELDLEALAAEVCRRYRAAYPDEQGRYGDAGIAWCVHDNQHLLNWAALECSGLGAMERDVRWLAAVLEAREFPLDRLAHDLDLAADVVAAAHPGVPGAVVEALRRSAALVRDTPTFLAAGARS